MSRTHLIKSAVWAVFAAVVVLALPSRSEALEFGVLGGLNYTHLKLGSENDSTQKFLNAVNAQSSADGSWAFGVTAYQGFGLLPLALEIDALLVRNKTTFTASSGGVGSKTEVSWTAVQVPVLVRFSVLPFLSLGAGGYLSHGLGNINDTTLTSSTGSSIVQSKEWTYSDAKFSQDDYGAVVSLGLNVPLPMTGTTLVGDLRYLHGLTNLDTDAGTSKVDVYHRAWQILAGVRWDL